MSSAARNLETTKTPRKAPSSTQRAKSVSRARQQARAARSKLHLRFWIFAALTVSLLTIGLVAISALRVQTDYTIRSAQVEAAQAQSQHSMLVEEVAKLSAPARVAAWAHEQGLVAPTNAIILSIPGPGSGTPPGSSSPAPGGSGG